MKATRFSRLIVVLGVLSAGMAFLGPQDSTTPSVEAAEASQTSEAAEAPQATVEVEGYILSEEGGEGYLWSQGHDSPESTETPETS